jgi:hypothetical protein
VPFPVVIAAVQPAVRHNAARIGHAKFGSARRQVFQQEQVILVRAFDLNSQRIAKFRGASRMIDMAMRKQNFLNPDIGLFDSLENIRHITTGIHHCTTHVFFIENQ